ncbi:MAG: phosphoribosylglycinamide formyltransferase [Defluviicoccus sp.]|nr:phosphoribosylglycinamide formyltransferase [Defluviicoccus sp.]MDG4593449.1 phosphoribosylglycinamide formyltransferase [Defluviicoccus sp.]MDS4011287.1 phosphoribosylglycinamide formyltransferase [Defluviicoccus sp.]MDS4073332.1 phosphoribosylglycinamide formyltransferase [Defluviicoccus sp.]
MAKLKIGVLISGRGSNLQALIDAAADSAFPATIATVISNEPGVAGLDRAQAAGIPTATINHRDFPDRAAFEDALHAALDEAGVELVCLAGFMRLLTEGFVRRWWDRLINIHPSLLPAFRGLHVHEAVLAYGARFSGCTVHYVRPAMDDGPIIVQAAVPVLADDDADQLAARILAEEHRIYPLAVRLIAEGRVRVAGERVQVTKARAPGTSLLNPLPD